MVMMYILFLFTLIFIRCFAGYDSRRQKGKYIVIKNEILSRLLLDKMMMLEKSYRLKKRQKQNVDCRFDVLHRSIHCVYRFDCFCPHSRHSL